jgi:hypothetical protein
LKSKEIFNSQQGMLDFQVYPSGQEIPASKAVNAYYRAIYLQAGGKFQQVSV